MTIILPPVWKAKNEANWVSDLKRQTQLKIQVDHIVQEAQGIWGGSLFSVLGDLLHYFFFRFISE